MGLAESVALLQAGVGRIQMGSFKPDPSMSALLNFQAGGAEEGRTRVLRCEHALHSSEGHGMSYRNLLAAFQYLKWAYNKAGEGLFIERVVIGQGAMSLN